MLAFIECLFGSGTLLNALHISFNPQNYSMLYLLLKKKGCHYLDNAQCHIVSEVPSINYFITVFIDHEFNLNHAGF